MKKYVLGQFAGLNMSFDLTAVLGLLSVWVILSAVGLFLLDLSAVEAILGGFVAAGLHFVSEFLHQVGHARAARKTGYPMTGVHYFLILGRSLYPENEGALPAKVHIQRALGGPKFSAIVTLMGGIMALILSEIGGVVGYVALFFFLDNLLTFTLGAFLPLGFTDGSTLLYWRNKS